MGSYLNRRVISSFVSSVRNLADGKAMAVVHNKKKIRIPGIDLDKEHRAMRIMTKKGYLEAREEGDKIYYTLTPKGTALYDSITTTYLMPS